LDLHRLFEHKRIIFQELSSTGCESDALYLFEKFLLLDVGDGIVLVQHQMAILVGHGLERLFQPIEAQFNEVVHNVNGIFYIHEGFLYIQRFVNKKLQK
jgi:hypothetical protein